MVLDLTVFSPLVWIKTYARRNELASAHKRNLHLYRSSVIFCGFVLSIKDKPNRYVVHTFTNKYDWQMQIGAWYLYLGIEQGIELVSKYCRKLTYPSYPVVASRYTLSPCKHRIISALSINRLYVNKKRRTWQLSLFVTRMG